jgi:hypothetical protein
MIGFSVRTVVNQGVDKVTIRSQVPHLSRRATEAEALLADHRRHAPTPERRDAHATADRHLTSLLAKRRRVLKFASEAERAGAIEAFTAES